MSHESSSGLVGAIIAAVLSASLNHSFWWGVLHFMLNWIYILYVLLVRSSEIIPALKAMFGV
jgi:hypothetical protein